MRTFYLLVPALSLVAGAALAQMMDVDTDGDGMVSYDELVAVYPAITEEDFAAMDADGSGLLDDSEMTAATEAGTLTQQEG